MAKISRVIQKQFGSTGPNGDFGQFGSLFAGSPTFTKDPATIQALSNFLEGFGKEVIGNYRPALEDVNSLFLLAFYQIAYMFQAGIPEWESTSTYYIGSVVQINGIIYISNSNNNVGNDPTTNINNWSQGVGGASGGVPPGAILPYGGNPASPPTGYLYGDGSAVSRTTYAALFSVYGVDYGAGNGSTTFNIPDGRGRTLVGRDGTAEFLTRGQVTGEKTHTLTPAEVPDLSLTLAGRNANGWAGPNFVQLSNDGGGSGSYTGSTDGGGEGPHNNIQPSLVIGGIIIKT